MRNRRDEQKMMNNSPIGVFDSGLGGLSVWREIRALLPEESMLYYGDGKNCPYGSRTEDEVARLTLAALEYLIAEGAKLAVVACNTASAAALDIARQRYDIPIVGMVPAVKPAAQRTQSGTVAILATERSLEGDKFQQYLDEFAAGVEVIPVVGHGFVDIVEQGREDAPETLEKVRQIVEPLIVKGADELVLGCTHYPFLSHVIREVIGNRAVEIVDPAPAIARRVAQLLDENKMTAQPGTMPKYSFHTLGGEDYLEKLIRKSGIPEGMVFRESKK